MPQPVISERITIIPESLANKGISGQKGVNQNYDKSLIHLPRQDFEVKPYSWLFWGSFGHTVANEQDFYYGNTTNDGMKRGKCKNDKNTVRLLGQNSDYPLVSWNKWGKTGHSTVKKKYNTTIKLPLTK